MERFLNFTFFAIFFLSCWVADAQDGSRLRQGFDGLDSDKDGLLSIDEIGGAPRLKERLQGADQDGDGSLSFSEFAQSVMRSLEPSSPKAVVPPASDAPLEAGERTRTVTVGQVDRRYLVYVPETYDAEEATPVVLAFHGGGGNPQSMVAISQLSGKAEEEGFLLVFPYGSGQDPDRFLTFNGGDCCGYAMQNEVDDVGYVRALLDDLAKVAQVDAGAVFATGLSNGGIMAYRLAAELADRIAAIAPVGGPLMRDAVSPSQPVAVMHFAALSQVG
ncbi:MAG: hypothetical protein AAF191_05675, partial [Verrucomicrobiota bacterium]